MCETSEEKMIASWNTIVPKILKLEGSLIPDSFNEEVMYTVIKLMDKKLDQQLLLLMHFLYMK